MTSRLDMDANMTSKPDTHAIDIALARRVFLLVRCTLSGKRAVSHDWPREIFEILVNKSFSSNAMVEYSDNDVATTLTDCVRGLLIHPFLLPANEHLEVCGKKINVPKKHAVVETAITLIWQFAKYASLAFVDNDSYVKSFKERMLTFRTDTKAVIETVAKMLGDLYESFEDKDKFLMNFSDDVKTFVAHGLLVIAEADRAELCRELYKKVIASSKDAVSYMVTMSAFEYVLIDCEHLENSKAFVLYVCYCLYFLCKSLMYASLLCEAHTDQCDYSGI